MSCFEGGPVPIQSAGDFLDQALDTARGGPDGLAIIEHQGKDRREKLALSDTSDTHEVLLDEGGGDPRLARDDVQELPELAVLVNKAHEMGPAASRHRSTVDRVALVP